VPVRKDLSPSHAARGSRSIWERAFPQGLKPVDSVDFMYGLKPVPFNLKSIPFNLKPVLFKLKPVSFNLKSISFNLKPVLFMLSD
jgi:hypothetical protein